jgi:hypothetical protein
MATVSAVGWWNAAQDQLVRPLLRTHLETDEMKSSADGARLYLASTGPEALAVMPVLNDWEQAACEVANRSLSEEEWAQYMSDMPYDPARN